MTDPIDAPRVSQAITRYIIEAFLDGDGADLEPDSPLLEWHIIDSVGIGDLLEFTQRQFAVRIPDDEVSPRNFQSVTAITDMVMRLRGTPDSP